MVGMDLFKCVMMIMVLVVSCGEAVSGAKFDELYRSSWAMDHCVNEGEVTKLKLDNYSGAGFESRSKYLFGKVSIQIKLVEGDSAGTVTAFYMSSDGPNHNEFDFEFLGNTTGEPYIVQTNIYVNGVGNREQRLNLWFDPTTEFHTYSILWSKRSVVFMVDETPIRVQKNLEEKGIPFAKDQAMGVYSSIWNADDWATQGGLVKTDWSHAPFVASYKEFQIDACEIPTTTDLSKCNGDQKFWWDEPTVSELSLHQNHQLIWVRANHMIYDYCFDATRFPVTPLECQHHRHDTFFLKVPSTTRTLPEDYVERVKRVHESGGYGSRGYNYDWKREEANKNLLRTHTTAVSSRMLYALAQKPFVPKKYFSIDRVFRNEAVDRTHLAEFHQIEGLICDRGLTLGDLIGVLEDFFSRLGMSKLRFKPAYNPYTEPSMEIFSYHEGLGKWVEIGNSGMFRPEMLLPMGLPEDVRVIAWGLSLERPTMILYGIDNIRDLFGHKVDLDLIKRNPICRIGI